MVAAAKHQPDRKLSPLSLKPRLRFADNTGDTTDKVYLIGKIDRIIENHMIPYTTQPTPCLQKLDRLKWADGICFEAYGAKVGVRVTNQEALAEIMSILPPNWQPAESHEVQEVVSYQVGGPGTRPGIRSYHLVYVDSVRMSRTHEKAEALHAVEACAQLAVAMRAKDRVFIHAGAVAWKGRIITLPGRSFAGKSTLVAALLKAGATNYSDEYTVLDKDGFVHPYPRKLSLRNGEQIARTRVTAEDLGSRTGVDPLPVGMVAVTTFRPEVKWTPRPLSAGKAGLAMFNNAVAAMHRPQECLTMIERAVSGAVCVQGARGDADETAERILSACEW